MPTPATVEDATQKAKAIDKAIIKAEKKEGHERLKRSMGCTFTVRVTYHEHGKSPKPMMVEMKDSFTLKEVQRWLQIIIWGEPHGNDKEVERNALRFGYLRHNGDVVDVTKGDDLMGWLDRMWCRHPLQLHVYQNDKVAAECKPLRINYAEKLFAELDNNQSGTLDAKEMLMAQELIALREVDPDQTANFIQTALAEADADRSHDVTKEEFLAVFGKLSDHVNSGLLERSDYHSKMLESTATESSTGTKTLADMAKTNAKGDRVQCYFHARPDCDHGASITFPVGSFDDQDEAMMAKTWEAKTVMTELVDQFDDPSETIGELCSPFVYVKFEAGTKLTGSYELMLPHSFDETTPEDDPLKESDLVVAYALLSEGVWKIVPDEDYTLVKASDNPRGFIPAVKIRLSEEAVVGIFDHQLWPLAQRVICIAFAPELIIPLEPDVMRVRIVQDVPGAVASAIFQEEKERGLCVVAGCSKPIRVLTDESFFSISIGRKGSEKTLYSTETMWDGEPQAFDCTIYPHEWEGFEPGQAIDYEVSCNMTAMIGRRFMPNPNRKFQPPDSKNVFDAHISLHNFPPPSEPLATKVVSRTQTNLQIDWEPPAVWGGCALLKYEVALREQHQDGSYTEWEMVKVTEGWESETDIAKNIWACEFKVRAYNVGCIAIAGAWSEVCVLRPEAEEEELNKERAKKELEEEIKERRRPKKRATKKNMVEADEHMAIIEYDDSKPGKQKQFQSSSKMEGWNKFDTAIGQYFLEVGVPGGVKGTLFELHAKQVHHLVIDEQSQTRGIGEDNPLLALGVAGIWVMQTLCQYARQSGPWMLFLNRVLGLLNYVAFAGIGSDRDTQKEIKVILYTLVEAFESLQQCETNGYIARQLEATKKKAHLHSQVKKEWSAMMDLWMTNIVIESMNCAKIGAGIQHAANPVHVERVQLGWLAKFAHVKDEDGKTVVEGRNGSMSFKLIEFLHRNKAETWLSEMVNLAHLEAIASHVHQHHAE